MRAWWEGYDPLDYMEQRAGESVEDPTVPENIALPKSFDLDAFMAGSDSTRDAAGEGADYDFAEEDHPDPVWPRAKMEICQRVFGRGFVVPGGADRAVEAVRPLGLDPVQQVLDLSVGLGGPAAAMAERYGVWITGYERNPALLDLAATVLPSVKAGDQVRVNPLDPETLYLPRKKFDVVLSHESLHRVADRIQLMGKVRNALKDFGQFMITDYVLPSDAPPSKRLRTWIANRGEPVVLWTREQYEVAFANQSMDIRVIKDESGQHAEMIRSQFADFVATLNASKSITRTPVGRAAMGDVAEDWSRLASLLQAGELQLLRFLAMKPEEA